MTDREPIKYIRRAALCTFFAALVFYAFFQSTKLPAISQTNPFAQDPYDAVGSIAIQVAVGVGILTLGRVARHRHDSFPKRKLDLVWRENVTVLAAIVVTLITDAIATLQQPIPLDQPAGMALLSGLVIVSALTVVAGATLVKAVRRSKATRLFRDSEIENDDSNALAETLLDLWALVEVTMDWLISKLSFLEVWWQRLHRLIAWICVEWTTRVPWLDPRSHPWRFLTLIALGAGVALALAHAMFEGVPANPVIILRVSVLFIGIEFAAAMLGFLLLGGLLGIRPPIRQSKTISKVHPHSAM
jgi:Ca2+/Na+ antiporter